MRELFEDGHRVVIDIWWPVPHAEGLNALTSAVLEGMERGRHVYLAKINERRNAIGVPFRLASLHERVGTETGGTIDLMAVKESGAVRTLATKAPLTMFQALLKEFCRRESPGLVAGRRRPVLRRTR